VFHKYENERVEEKLLDKNFCRYFTEQFGYIKICSVTTLAKMAKPIKLPFEGGV